MCSYMPKSISAQCTTFVDTYTEMIIDMLTKVKEVVRKIMLKAHSRMSLQR